MDKLPTALVKRRILWTESKGGAYFSIARRRFIKAEITEGGTLFIYYLTPGIYLFFELIKGALTHVRVSYRKVFPGSKEDVEGDMGIFVFKDPESLPEKIVSDLAKWGFPPMPNLAPYDEREVQSLIRFVKAHSVWREGLAPRLE